MTPEIIRIARDHERRLAYEETLESVSSSTTTPSEIGQVMFTTDGLSWSAELPVTSKNGWLVNDDGILIVVG